MSWLLCAPAGATSRLPGRTPGIFPPLPQSLSLARVRAYSTDYVVLYCVLLCSVVLCCDRLCCIV
mgnify:FL=1